MSLITCPECGNNISSLASLCPKCGHPLRKAQASGIRGWHIEPKVWAATAWATVIAWFLSPVFSVALPSMLSHRSVESSDLWVGIIVISIWLCIYCGLLWLLVTRRWRYSLTEKGRYLGWTIGQATFLAFFVGRNIINIQALNGLAGDPWMVMAQLSDFIGTFLLAINTIAIPARNLSGVEVAHKLAGPIKVGDVTD